MGSLARSLSTQHRDEPAPRVTLLELVRAVGDSANNDREVVATVLHMLSTGSVTLCGNFRDEGIESFRP